ncbi:MAG TPA: ACT domain-containing protein, partial [Halothiobacillaceae bacterium]|nr:ACT domain-containing protein [Halothiobacillaceae bacterium]
EQPQKIVGHAQSLAQCRGWLDRHYAGVERVAVASNAIGAVMAADDPSIMALGAEIAADRYNLTVVARNIQDDARNTTRFAILGREQVPISGKDKTSLLVSVKNEPGALARLLEPLSANGIDVSRIESRPARDRVWDYVFFIDFSGHRDDPIVRSALNALAPHCGHLRVLGSYPQPVLGSHIVN